jgi:hypothetical protein
MDEKRRERRSPRSRVPAMLRRGCGSGLNSGDVMEVSGGGEDMDGDQHGAAILRT